MMGRVISIPQCICFYLSPSSFLLNTSLTLLNTADTMQNSQPNSEPQLITKCNKSRNRRRQNLSITGNIHNHSSLRPLRDTTNHPRPIISSNPIHPSNTKMPSLPQTNNPTPPQSAIHTNNHTRSSLTPRLN